MTDEKTGKTKVLTPETRLVRRINREFTHKKMIGDIAINDDEYELLLEMFRFDYSLMVSCPSHVICAPSFAVALVQIGIRNYDGAFWPHVKKALRLSSFPSNHQTWIGNSFFATLKKYNKLYVSVGEHVDNILMHAFVSDVFSDKFFNFLFAFYRIDLDGDISRLDRSMMNELIETIKREDNSGRTYLLVEHTADAVRKNTRGAKTRIRRYLNLIDKAFWGDDIPDNSSNRLMNRFLYWKDNSAEFISDKAMRVDSGKRGRKSFFAPLMYYDAQKGLFKILLTKQIIRFYDTYNLWWKIETKSLYKEIAINSYNQGVTGNQTDEAWLNLDKDVLFESFSFSLMNGEERIRYFKISSENIRFFDADGYFQKNDCLQEGEYTSFSAKDFIPVSTAILYKESRQGMLCAEYDFVKGDLVCLPDGKPIAVGGKIQEGIGLRGRIEGLQALINDIFVPVYSSLPTVLIKLPPSRLNGTVIQINSDRIRMCSNGNLDSRIAEVELNDRSGEKGYVINLSEWISAKDGIFQVIVDAPNERSYRNWTFAYIKNFSYEFEDAPYVYKSRGTLSIPLEYEFKSFSRTCRKEISDKRRFDFDIEAENLNVSLSFKNVDYYFEVPALSYCFKGEGWMVDGHTDVWYTDFKPMLYLRFNADRIKIFLDESNDDCEAHQAFFTKIKSKGLFECDLNIFKSWFGREQIFKNIKVELPGVEKAVSLLRVVTRSVVNKGILTGDYERDIIKGEFDIIGHAEYYVYLLYENEIIAKDIKLENGCFEIESEIRSGQYQAIVFETEPDDSGFGEIELFQIGELAVELVNPKDLSGTSVEIYGIKPLLEESVFLKLNPKYKIINLEPIANLRNVYIGKMVVEIGKLIQATFYVRVEFPDINKLDVAYISYEEDGENIEFLYDEVKGIIVKREDKSLSKSQAYRRYRRSLFQEDYMFDVGFFNADARYYEVHEPDDSYNNLKERKPFTVFKESIKKSISIEKMNFSIRTYNIMSRAGCKTAEDIAKLSKEELFKVRNLGKEGAEEVILKMRSCGYDFPKK